MGMWKKPENFERRNMCTRETKEKLNTPEYPVVI